MSTLIVYTAADATLNIPVVPGGWDLTVEGNRWCTIYPLGIGGVSFFARLIARGTPTTRAVFVCTGSSAVLNRLATYIAGAGLPWAGSWSTLTALRNDSGATAVAIRAAWVDERPHLFSGPIGATVDGGPVGTLVALYARMAGFGTDDGEA
jgi:hypothetical protein